MKFCYADETGHSGNEQIFVMVGIIIDEKKLHKYSREVGEKIRKLESEYHAIHDKGFKEIKTHALLSGKNKGWSKISPDIRKEFCLDLCKMAQSVPFQIVFSAIDREKHSALNFDEYPDFCKKYWQSAAIQIALEAHCANSGTKRNKGKTLLIFDNNQQEASNLSDFLFQPDEWIKAYYNPPKKEPLLDNIIDTAFGIKSHHSGLVQVADCYAYIIRRCLEIRSLGQAEKWNVDGGEFGYISQCMQLLSPKLELSKKKRNMKPSSAPECINFYNQIAPDELMKSLMPPYQIANASEQKAEAA